MKILFFALIITINVVGCGKKNSNSTSSGSASIVRESRTMQQLKEAVVKALTTKDKKLLRSLIYLKETPELMKAPFVNSIIDCMNSHSHFSNAEIYEVSKYTPKMDLPGKFQGQVLVYTHPPSHWFVITLKIKNTSTGKLKITLPFSSISGNYFIPGARFKS